MFISILIQNTNVKLHVNKFTFNLCHNNRFRGYRENGVGTVLRPCMKWIGFETSLEVPMAETWLPVHSAVEI